MKDFHNFSCFHFDKLMEPFVVLKSALIKQDINIQNKILLRLFIVAAYISCAISIHSLYIHVQGKLFKEKPKHGL